jgi:uncharacterized protein YecA (UPF0149 family)
MNMDESEFADIERSILAPMIRRHEQMFPLMHQRSPLASPHWDIMSAPPLQEQTPITPPADRYAPCPCNSGKKYKFCCGRRS